MTKPILIGLYNPYSPNPEHALVPYPERSAGHRLWKMLDSAPMIYGPDVFLARNDKDRYADAFDRRNLAFKFNDTVAARLKALACEMDIPKGSHVILLGREVLTAFTTKERPLKALLIHPQVHDGVTWRWLPHPSGRVTQYNDPVFRMLAGMVLADVLTLTGE